MKSRYSGAAARAVALFVMVLLPAGTHAQTHQRAQLTAEKAYMTPFPGFKIAGNFYYVGTYDIASYLIDTGAGSILINTGTPGSYALIKANIDALGFKTSDIKIITATHAHWDHVADFASFKKDAPGAKVYISERDALAVESGGNPDPRKAYSMFYLNGQYRKAHANYDPTLVLYDPVKVDVRTKPGDHIKLGNTDMTVLQAYGHTPGAISFNFSVQDGSKKYNVYIVNMDWVGPGVSLLYPPGYPTLVEDIRDTLAQQARYKPDIWVASHGYQFNLHAIYKPGDPYNPSRFGDLAAYKAKIAGALAALNTQLAAERAQKLYTEPPQCVLDVNC